MRTIIFDGHEDEDPVYIGEIFEIVRGEERHIVQAVPEKGMGYCEGCVFFNRVCSVPQTEGAYKHICPFSSCVFQSIDNILEGI